MPLRYGPWFSSLACLVAAGVQAQPAAEPPEDPGTQVEAGATGDEPSGLSLLLDGPLLGPVSPTGSLTYSFSGSRSDRARSTNHLMVGTLSANTFVLAPWFARLSGTLGLSAASARQETDDSLAVGPVSAMTSRERFLTGSVRVAVFPLSRFPFEAHAEASDSRTGTGLMSPLHFRSYSFGLTQRYRPEDNAWRASATFAHHGQRAEGVNQSQNALSGEYFTGGKFHQVSLGASFSKADGNQGERSTFQSLVARHSWSPEGGLSVDSTANVTRTTDRYGGFPSELAVLQVSSVAIWSPPETRYTLTGAVRAGLSRDLESGQTADTLGLTAGGSYVVSPNVRLSANAHYGWFHAAGSTSQGLSASAAASWSGDTFEWNGFRYDQFGGLSAGGTVGSGTSADSQFGVQAQVGHSLSRSIAVGEDSHLQLQMSQSLSVAHIGSSAQQPLHPGLRRDPTERHLQQTASATWSGGSGSASAYARMMLSDYRDLTSGGARYQLANFQLSGTYQISNRSSLTGDLTVQRSVQVGGSTWDGGLGLVVPGTRSVGTGASGEVTFRQDRLFGVPRLSFTSRLKLAQDVLRQPGTFISIPERETLSWENELSWSIGRLQSQLYLRISEAEGRRFESLMWRAQRSFGD